MGAFLQSLRNLGPMRLAIMGGVLLGLVAFFIFLTTRLTGTQMTLLYGDLQSEDSSRIAGQLGGMNVPYEIKRNGSQIFVPGDKAHSLRLQMAERGLPNGGSIGYEIFDKSDGLGTTNFVQNMNMVRALEGELSRTIRAISSVGSARVHLVLPRRELFSREKQQPSASIIIGMRGPGRLDREQVLAVQHLVAAAVPGLAPNRISIVDDKGSLLARGFEDEGGDAVAAARGDERRRAYEVRVARTIEQMLEKSVGFGKVRAEVSVEMDFDRVNINEETFNPDGQVVRSTQTVSESRSSREADGAAPVSVGANLPDAGQGASTGTNNAEARTEETVNYEISRKVINHVRESGLVKRLSVAVVVDGVTTGAANGERQWKEREKPEMDLLATLVRTAVGFNADRGDTVEVVNLRFAEAEVPSDEPIKIFGDFTKADLMRMSEILVMSIVAVLVILLVVRPLLSRAFEALPSMAGAMAAEARLLAEQVAQTPALAGPGGVGAPGEEEVMEELIDIDRVEGRVKASSVKKVGEIVEKHPDEALSIIRSWMYQEA